MPNQTLTLRDAGRILGLAPETVRRAMQRGDLPGRRDDRDGRRPYLFDRADVEAYRLERERRRRAQPAMRKESNRRKSRDYGRRSSYVRCKACNWKGRRLTGQQERWKPCPRCGGALRLARRSGRMDPAVVAVRVRALLIACARSHDLPTGYAPSQNAYTRWAKRNRQPGGNELRGMVARAWRLRVHAGRGWRANWSDVVSRAGLEMWINRQATDAELVEDIRRVARELAAAGEIEPGQAPTRAAYRRLGRYDHCTITTRLLGTRDGSWHAVAFRVGLLPPRTTRYRMRPRESVVADYRVQCRKAGLAPGGRGLGQRRFEALVGYTVGARFGPWSEIVKEAGYRPRAQPRHFARAHVEAA